MARAGVWERVALHGQVPEHPTPQAAGAQFFAMDTGEDVGEARAAGRPAPLLEVLPQERVQQRTVEQIVDPVPVVPLLQAFVPQMVEQLVDILAPLDFRVAEQVIEVPKISSPSRHCRRRVRFAEQTADQLVEVPTIISYSSLLQRTMEQTVDIPVSVGGLADFAQDRVHPQLRTLQLLGSTLRMSLFNGFFELFPRKKKSATVTRHVGSSTSSAYGPRTWVDDDTGEVWTLLTDPALGSWWHSSRTHRSQWHPPWER